MTGVCTPLRLGNFCRVVGDFCLIVSIILCNRSDYLKLFIEGLASTINSPYFITPMKVYRAHNADPSRVNARY